MRSVCTYVSVFSASLLATVATCTFANPVTTHGSSVKVVHGLSNAKRFQAPADGQFYVQAGTFKSAKSAENYKRQLANKFRQPVQVRTQDNYHVVVVGPMHSAAEVRAVGGSTDVMVPVTQQVRSGYIRDKDGLLEPIGSPDRFEVIGALGVANLRAGDSWLGVTSSETNRLVMTNKNQWNSFAAQLGVGYLHYFGDAVRYSDLTQWFPSIQPQVNVYYIDSTNLKGDVWRFGSPDFNQLTFKAPVRSTRLMFDVALTLLSRQQYSLYGIGGIGNAWNRMSYSDRDNEPNDPCANEALHLNANTRSNFAWEAGAGLMYTLNDRTALTLQYLYADLGKASSSANGTSGTITAPIIVAPRFNLSAQTASIGLHFAI